MGELLSPSSDPTGADVQIARLLFERLQQEGIDYAKEPWRADGRQQIRHPRWLVEDRWGTCLDLAVTYAAMCLDAHLGPLLAVTKDHAFVIIVPGRLRETIGVPPWSERSVEQKGERGGVSEVMAAEGMRAAIESGALLAVDVVRATTRYGEGFEEAVRAGREFIDTGLEIIDVAFLQARGVEPLAPPAERPSIQTYLPGGQGELSPTDPQAAALQSLREATGTVVLLAPQGQGKSTVARRLVGEAPFGAGWFLNASEPQALIGSLADADRAEHNADAAGLGSPDRRGFYERARAHLNEVEGRWIVVLDNADGDPGKLTPLLPSPGDGQLLLVTSTNREWEHVPGVRVRRLQAIDDESVVSTLGDGALVGLVAGRALLLYAFRALMDSTGLSAGEIASCAPEVGEVDEPARGPRALWGALRARLGQSELRVCLQMAYLPPDQQPVEVLAGLAPGAAELTGRLAAQGLITREAQSVRMHRLLGAAVRADLALSEPDMEREVVLELATDAGALATLDRYGDLETLIRLDDRLAAIDELIDESIEGPDARLGEALHAVAGLLELAGHTRRSGETYLRAERHLAGRPDLRADVLHSRARTVNQHHAKDEPLLREALGWAEEAERMLLETPGREESSYRCLAMQGLLRQKLAAFPGEGETTLGLLQQALAVIEEAHELRVAALDPMDPELARSEFNLAGIRVNLAQREPEQARRHLDDADRVYAAVAERREKIYGRKVHPHIAACIIGRGYVDYYRALLLPASPTMRTRWLRGASDHAGEALSQRQALDGSLDLDESKKALRFLTKVMLVRQASVLQPAVSLDSVNAEVARELAFAAVQQLPSSARELSGSIAAWLFSPALAAVVAAFGETAPMSDTPLGEALEWFEDFSLRWDFRGGQERNLAVAKDLTPEIEAVVMKAAGALGLRGTSPPQAEHYDQVLVLGGLLRACIARPLYAARLLDEGIIKAPVVTALGGYRPLSGDEHALAARIGCHDLSDEFEALDEGVRRAFHVSAGSERGERSERVGESWAVREYGDHAKLTIRVVAAPSSEPGLRRANTADTYKWFASELAQLRSGERVLILTSDIYVPFQHADALRMLALPYDVEVDAAGIRPGDAAEELAQVFQSHNYLQEMRSTIRALRALYGAWLQTR
ncbi:MAG TPA: hypothetical protein VID70_01860 [Solirubrobacteraceae bacterium]